MKNASPGLIALLSGNTNFIMADLWTFSLRNGLNLYYTDADINLTLAGQAFAAKDVLVTGGQLKQSRGLQVNECDVTCYPDTGAAPSLVGATPFLQAVRTGILDRAGVTRKRLFMPTWGDTSLGAITMFVGEVTDSTLTRYTADLKCKELTNLLNTFMPIRQYQPTCSWVFGSTQCTVSRTGLASSGTVAAGSTQGLILSTIGSVAGYYNNGTVKFTSGANAGLSMTVKSWSPHAAQLVAPMPSPVAIGDAFTISPGCTKNYLGPIQSFNGTVTDGITALTIPNGLGNGAGAFNGFTLHWTSGANNGKSGTIGSWQPNYATMQYPFPNQPNYNDAFQILNGATVVATSNVTSLRNSVSIPNQLTNASGVFSGGSIRFTSGPNVGQVRTVSSWTPGLALLSAALPNNPVNGDGFTITTPGGAAQSTCSGYSNTANFGGMRFVPVPETAY